MEQPQDEQVDEGLMEAMGEEGLIAMTKKARLALEKTSVLYVRHIEEIKACFQSFQSVVCGLNLLGTMSWRNCLSWRGRRICLRWRGWRSCLS